LTANHDIVEGKYSQNLTVRSQLDAIEEKMHGMETTPIADFPLRHHFADGMYAREMFMPAGTLITGKIKKHEHLSIISLGEVYEATEHGAQHVKAPHTFVSAPGTKRLVYCLSDCVWTTVHRTDETDLDKLDDELIAKTHADVPGLEVVK
jgi:hypothetical protein